MSNEKVKYRIARQNNLQREYFHEILENKFFYEACRNLLVNLKNKKIIIKIQHY